MRLLHNARIHTLAPSMPFATALVVSDDGRILATGGEEIIAQFPGAEIQDMGQGIILPGLTDAHLHLQEYACGLARVDCELPGQDEILHRIREAASLSREGNWVRGHGWNQNTWGGQWPTAAALDAVTGNRPAYLTSKSLHCCWVNSRALALAGIHAETPDPAGGKIQRDESGRPTGILFEKAMKLVESVIPELPPREIADLIGAAIPNLWRFGLTGIHDYDRRACFQALQILHQAHELRLRVVKTIPQDLLPHAIAFGVQEGFGDDMLRLGPVKLFADGALGPRTGAMIEPYAGEPLNRGMLLLDQEAIFEIGCQAGASGLGLAVHAIGDRAVHEVLDGLERLRSEEQQQGWPRRRHRIEHVQTIHPADASRLAGLGVIASMQPVHAVSDMLMAEEFLGERSAYSYAARLQIDHGARLAFGSDAPVESPDPFLGMHAAVTRRRLDGTPGPDGWHQELRLSIREAVEAYTLGPAFASSAEDRLGRLAAGYLADLIVLERDPFQCDPDELHRLRPVATMLGGEWVWEA